MTTLSPWCRSLPRFSALAEAVLRQAAELAAAAEQLPAAFGPENAKGAQLDLLGASLNIPRGGMNDNEYRAMIPARLAALRWDGTNGSVKPLLDGLAPGETYSDNGNLTVSASSAASSFIPAGISRILLSLRATIL